MEIGEKIDKITKSNFNILNFGSGKTPILNLGLLVYMTRKPDKYTNFSNEKKFNFTVKDNDYISHWFDFTGSCITLSSRVTKGNDNKFLSLLFYPRDFKNVLLLLKNSIKWFSEEYLDVFKYDAENNPFEVNRDKYKKLGLLTHLKYGQGNYFATKPSVIVTTEGNYKGILLLSNKGKLGEITYDELESLIFTLEDIMHNFHSMVLELVNLSVTYQSTKEINNVNS